MILMTEPLFFSIVSVVLVVFLGSAVLAYRADQIERSEEPEDLGWFVIFVIVLFVANLTHWFVFQIFGLESWR